MFTDEQLQDLFRYHSPEPGDPERYQKIRDAGYILAKVIVDNTPSCADQSVAIRKVREAVATANAAVALKGRV